MLHSPSTDCLNLLLAGMLYDLYPHLINQNISITSLTHMSMPPNFWFSFGLKTYKVDFPFYHNCPYVCPTRRQQSNSLQNICRFVWNPGHLDALTIDCHFEWQLETKCTNHVCENSQLFHPGDLQPQLIHFI